MSLPIPNMGNPLASLGASVAIGQQGIRSASQIAQRTTLAFGDLLSQLSPLEGNGPSEAKSLLPSSQQTGSDAPLNEEPSSTYGQRIQSMRAKLQSWLDATCKQLGIQRDSQPIDIRLDTEQRLEVSGPEPLRSKLFAHLSESQELSSELLTLQKMQPSSLPWLPAATNQDFGSTAATKVDSRVDPLLIQL